MPHIRVLAVLAIGALAGPVMAQSGPRLSEIIATLEDKGYGVTEVDVDRDKIEVEARRSDGVRVDLDINPVTGAVIREEVEG